MCHKVLKLKSDTSVYVGVIYLVHNCPLQKRFCLCKVLCQWVLVQVKASPYGSKAREGNCKNKNMVALQGSSASHRYISVSFLEYIQFSFSRIFARSTNNRNCFELQAVAL